MADLLNCKPLFSFSRRGVLEVLVHGVAAFKSEGQVLQGDAADINLVTRSLLKPWQALGTGGFSGDDPKWSLCISSHSGQPSHQEQLRKLLLEMERSEEDLVCPRAFAMDPTYATLARQANEKPSRLLHPCSGKHLLMLAAAKNSDDPNKNYWEESHPIQKRIQALVGREASEKITWVTDSCGLPVAVMSIRAILNMYERFALDQSPQVVQLRKLWIENPRLVGGHRRLDSDITEIFSGRLLAKEGADGLLVVQSLAENGNSVASILIKIASGYNATHLALGLWCAISARPAVPKVFEELKEYLKSRLEEWAPKDQQLTNLLINENLS